MKSWRKNEGKNGWRQAVRGKDSQAMQRGTEVRETGERDVRIYVRMKKWMNE